VRAESAVTLTPAADPCDRCIDFNSQKSVFDIPRTRMESFKSRILVRKDIYFPLWG
jgi:hypothetical protein